MSAMRLAAGARFALLALAVLVFWPAAGYAATISSLGSVSIPLLVLNGSKSQADAAVVGPQSVQLNTANTYAAPARVGVEIDITGASFVVSSNPSATGLTGCTAIVPLTTKIIFDGCTATGNTFQISGLSYNNASALATGASITLSGLIYNANNSSQTFETITASPVVTGPTVSYTLTTSTTGTGSGTVSASPQASSYASGATVTLTATPASGATFAGWSGGGCGTATTCQVTMNENKTVTATFNLIASTYTLTTSTAGTGSGSVSASPQASSYAFGTAVTLTASPASGSTFAGWSGSGGCSGAATTCQVTMSSNLTVTATFSSSAGAGGTLRQASVFSSASPSSQSFLRFYNAGTAPGTVTVTLSNYASGQTLGQWTSPSIAPGTAPQYAISTIESALPNGSTKPAFYAVTMQSQFAGTFQHVLWKSSDGTLTNLSTCDAGITAIPTRATNVHSSVLGNAGYPASVVVYNTGAGAVSVSLTVSDAATGRSLGSYSTPTIPANGEQILTVSALESALGITPTSSIAHYNITVQGQFNGYLMHLLNNALVGVITDMSTVCSFSTSTTTQPPPTNPSGAG